MNKINSLKREIKFLARDRIIWLWLALVFCLSSAAVGFGLAEIAVQNKTIEQLIQADKTDRALQHSKKSDWGSAAYYGLHLTYDAPSDFAFAALGMRDTQPWKHRLKMLALEGQVYERDVGNPSVAILGRFDFAFFAAFVFPLVLMVLLYDLRAHERSAGRINLIEATVAQPRLFWLQRASIRTLAVLLCLIVPLIIGGLIAGASALKLVLACLAVIAYGVFWGLVCFWFSAWRKQGQLILISLIALWVMTAVLIPSAARLAIDRAVPVPDGADILMLQRETVNDAWDLPRKMTMDAFFERHPQWADYQPVESSFEWQWYYAFQQVGDQRAEPLSMAYREGRKRRAELATWFSVFAPPSLLEQTLQALANTDAHASLEYEERVRAFHAELRAFYYPLFFRNVAFDRELLEDLPNFDVH
ncbi:DUF3526 domain-containing protein [Saccharophagus degradans]|uniref:DUF3526 domain-containing protein n=1 Tax=Saccharophagus degradans TaxID=86304 RepID=UPI001C09F63B|nr:DUF3526 domain-containing protein [Saccharophagus degradans]MBU2985002.1 DUF3526 domain-containing protein [Saccharophagus degradans]